MEILRICQLLLSIVFCVQIRADAESETTLQLLQIVMRHGIRTPVNLYSTDPYNETYWSQYGGLGLLTQAGMNQQYEHGKFIKDRYSNFLTQPYDPSRVFARSTDYDRALQSAYTLLAGLYPPSTNQVWNTDFPNWNPIPVRANDRKIDPILHGAADCPRYDYLKASQQQTPLYYQIQDQNIDFIRQMANYSGISNLDLYTMWKIADNYMVESALNLSIPQWVTDNKDKILALNDYNFLFDYYTMEMAKLISGGVLNDMVTNIGKKLDGSSKREFVLYSSHDTYVAALHKLFNLTDPIVQPNFASALYFELRKSVNSSDYFIRVLYKNNVDNTPIVLNPLNIEGMELCPLDNFLEMARPYLVTSADWSVLCANPPFTTAEPSLTSQAPFSSLPVSNSRPRYTTSRPRYTTSRPRTEKRRTTTKRKPKPKKTTKRRKFPHHHPHHPHH